MLLLCNSPTLVLIDCGVIHSFLSVSDAEFLNRKFKSLRGGMLISSPSGEDVMVGFVWYGLRDKD